MGIVQEIQSAVKAIIATETGYTQLDYEYDIDLNSDRGYEERFGFIPSSADFSEGRAIGFTTMDHSFTIILTNDFMNKDDDTPQNSAAMDLYEKQQNLIKEIQKSKLVLPTPTNRVLLIRGINIDDPEFSGDNSTVGLKANISIQYQYRNN